MTDLVRKPEASWSARGSKEQTAVQPEWREPISLDGPLPPAFPLEVLPTGLRSWVEAEATAYQVPIDMPAMLALGCISAAVAGRVTIRVAPDWTEECCAYTAIVLPSGERKSPLVQEAVSPLEWWEREALKRDRDRLVYLEQKEKIAEKRLGNARDAAARAKQEPERLAAEEEVRELALQLDRLERPVFPRLLADDATPEALVSLMAEQGGRIAVVSAEGGLFDILAGRYTDGLNLDAVLKAYGCESIRVDRKGRASEYISRPALALVFAVQPAVLESLAQRPQLRGRGLLARFWYAVPQSELGRRELDPPAVPPNVRRSYQARLSDLLDGAAKSAQSAETGLGGDSADLANSAAGSERPELVLHSDAQAALRSFRARLEPRLDRETGDLFAAADWTGKLAGSCVRIAALLHLYEHGWSLATSKPIDGTTMCAAVEVGEYMIPHALIALGLTGPRGTNAAPARTILRWIKREELAAFKASDVLDALSRNQFPSMASVEAALHLLEEFEYVRKRPAPRSVRAGRPASPTYDVNPKEVRSST